jgi:hydrogenase-4 membrane subunit HyfE
VGEDEIIEVGCAPIALFVVIVLVLLGLALWRTLDALNSPAYSPTTSTSTR